MVEYNHQNEGGVHDMCLVIMLLLLLLAAVGFLSAFIAWVCSTFGMVAACVVGFLALGLFGGLMERRNKK